MPKFTDRYIDSLQPRSTRYDIREGQGEGFAVRVSPNGRKTWTFIYKHQGQKKRMSLGIYPGMTLRKARSRFRELRDLLDQGIDPIDRERERDAQKKAERLHAEREANAHSVTDLGLEYIEKWAKPRKRSWKEDERILHKDVIPAWGKRKAKDITRQDVVRLLDDIVDRGAGIQANRTLALVRKMFNFAVGRSIVDISPCMGVAAPAKENRRSRVLDENEIRTLWNALEDASMAEGTKLALKLQLVTAQRIGEIVNAQQTYGDFILNWSIVNFGKHKGKSLPQILCSDPDWFFWAIEEDVFSNNGIIQSQAKELDTKARNIKIPGNDNATFQVEYYIHPPTKKFSHFEIVPTERELHQGGSRAFRRNVIDMSVPRKIAQYDKTGCKSLLESMKGAIFGSSSARLTKDLCEKFFSNNSNFA